MGIYIHLAGAAAFAAVYAFALIYPYVVEAYFIKQSVDRAERTEQFAEEAFDKNASQDNGYEYAELNIE